MKFTLEITLGNAAMQTGDDVARALHKIADYFDGCGEIAEGYTHSSGAIMDENGNRVGQWTVKP